MNIYRHQTVLRLLLENHKKITAIANKNKRSYNAQIEFLIETCIQHYEKKHGKIKVSEE
jgi:hypothetical protein